MCLTAMYGRNRERGEAGKPASLFGANTLKKKNLWEQTAETEN